MRGKIITLVLLGFSICFLTVGEAVGQDRIGETVRIETVDGNLFVGQIVDEDDQKVVLKVEGIGEITVEKSNIRNLRVIDSARVQNGNYWYENTQGTRYFFAPNALSLGKGKGYYQNVWIFFNNVNYGITDRVSIGGGIVPMFLLGVSETPAWLLPKVSFPVADNVHLAAGAMLGGVIGSGSGGAGLLYGSATYGDRDRNLSAGLGYGYAGRDWSNTPLVNVSGMYRTSRSLYLLGELYFLPGIEGSGAAIGGLRWSTERLAVDFGLGRPLFLAGGFIGLPWVGVSIPFGN